MRTLVHYLFPAIAGLYLVLGLRASSPIQRRAQLRTAAIFAIVSLLVWWLLPFGAPTML